MGSLTHDTLCTRHVLGCLVQILVVFFLQLRGFALQVVTVLHPEQRAGL